MHCLAPSRVFKPLNIVVVDAPLTPYGGKTLRHLLVYRTVDVDSNEAYGASSQGTYHNLYYYTAKAN